MTDSTDKTTPASHETATREAVGKDGMATYLTDRLTTREQEVLKLFTAGRTNRQIASDLFITEKTASRYVSSILTKLDIGGRATALVPPSSPQDPGNPQDPFVHRFNFYDRESPTQTASEHAPNGASGPSIVQVEAAKLRLVTDRRLGKVSPDWLQRVAKGLPPQGAKAAG